MNPGGFRRPRNYIQASTRLGLSSRRKQSSVDEEVIVFEQTNSPHDVIREILVHLIRDKGVTKSRKLAYLNALVRKYKELSNHKDGLGVSEAQLIYCLRSCALHKHSVIRAATYRCLRHVITTSENVQLFYRYKLDWCIARSLDLHFSYDIERNEAVKLCRHLIEVDAQRLQPAVVLPFVAIAGDGAAVSERMVLTSLEILCELAYRNAKLLSQCGGVQVILQHIIQCHDSPRINEALIQTLFYLLNNPQTRQDCTLTCGLDQLLAPFTDTHYRHNHDNSEGSSRSEERLLRCHACSQALLSTLHTWPGLVTMCNPLIAGLSSLINSLPLSSGATQKIILQLTYNVFLLRVPKWTDNFEEALLSCDPSSPDYSWRLKEGFVAAECLAVYKAVCRRPNLIDNHLSLLLSTFITYGILEALCDVVVRSDSKNSIWATVLLGELLYMSYLLLPWSDTEHTHYLPSLVTVSHSLTNTREQRSQAHQAVEYLDRLHTLKKRGRVPCSLHLDLLISFIPNHQSSNVVNKQQSTSSSLAAAKLEPYLHQDTEESLLLMIRDSLVLVEQNALQWRWSLINSILKSKVSTLRRVEDFTLNRFLAKLLHFYNPSIDTGFCTIKLSDNRARLYSSTGLLLLERILQLHSEEATRHLKSLLSDIGHALNEIRQETPVQEAKLGLNNIFSYCCRDYFLFIGKLSHYPEGLALLEETNVMQQLLDLVTITSHDAYVKLTVSSLDYTKEGMSRLILSKALTATSENARLYTADFMRALLRLRVPFFSSWCMDLLITQLYDQSRVVSMRSLSVINEACEDQSNLLSLISTRPSVLHLGEMGALLVTRYLSVQEGFKFLRSSSYLDKELDHWHESFNVKYASVVDSLLAESLSSYEKSYDDTVQRRSSAIRRPGKSVYVPPHLYGQLIQHTEGTEIVANLPYLHQYFDLIRNHDLQPDNTNIQQCKAAIWVTGHIGTSVFGLPLLDKQDVIPSLVNIAERSPLLTLRGTAFYALGLIASTQAGVQRLAELGWRSVMNHRSEEWPVLSDNLVYADPDAIREIRSASQASTNSQNSNKSMSTSDASSSRYEDEGARSRASTDELVDDMQRDINAHMYEQHTAVDGFEPAVRNGKAHSTSELVKASQVRGHRRCSSDSVRTIRPEIITPPTLSEDDNVSQTISVNTIIPSNDSETTGSSNDDTTPTTPNSPSDRTKAKPNKPTIKHQTSRSLIDMDSEGIAVPASQQTKSRSLSWRSDVVHRDSSQTRVNAESISSHVSSTDSAIDTKSISPIDTGRSLTLLAERTMSLPREKSNNSAIKRTRRFSSLQSPNHKQTPRKGIYETSKSEFGVTAVRAMRRQASTTSSNGSSSHNTSLQNIASHSPLTHSKSTDMIRSWSRQGDIDALSEARRISDIDPPNKSSSVRYMGLALPLDVTVIFELTDDLQLPRGSMDSDVPVTTFNYDQLSPINYSVDGLELHSQTNCLLCASLSSFVDSDGDHSSTAVGDKASGAADVSQTRLSLRKECIRFVTTICSSIGVNAAEEGLLRLREQFPELFQDICLYSEVCAILSTYSFHLPARRFIQELFQDMIFDKAYAEAHDFLEIDLSKFCCLRHKPPDTIIDDAEECSQV